MGAPGRVSGALFALADLARAAQVDDLVLRSISGHLTETMQAHYSTENGGEQRGALAKVISLVGCAAPDDPRGACQRDRL